MQDKKRNALASGLADTAKARTAYSTPSLRVLGTLADLTATGSKTGRETGGNKTGGKNFP